MGLFFICVVFQLPVGVLAPEHPPGLCQSAAVVLDGLFDLVQLQLVGDGVFHAVCIRDLDAGLEDLVGVGLCRVVPDDGAVDVAGGRVRFRPWELLPCEGGCVGSECLCHCCCVVFILLVRSLVVISPGFFPFVFAAKIRLFFGTTKK